MSGRRIVVAGAHTLMTNDLGPLSSPTSSFAPFVWVLFFLRLAMLYVVDRGNRTE